MKSTTMKCLLSVILTLALALPQSDFFGTVPQEISLPDGNIPVDLLYSDGKIWMGGYWTGALFEIASSSMTNVETYFVNGVNDNSIGLYGIAQDSNSNLWLSGKINGKIYKFDMKAKTFAEIYTAESPTNMEFLNGFVYIICHGKLLKINTADNSVAEIDLPCGKNVGINDFGANILLADVDNGEILEVDILTNTISTRVKGLHRPLDLVYDSANGKIYVSENVRFVINGYENGWTPSIVAINPSNWSIARTDVSLQGTPFSVEVLDGNVIWSSSAENELRSKTINILDGQSLDVGEEVYYLTSDGTSIYYSYYGSCGIGKIRPPQISIGHANVYTKLPMK